MEDNKTEELFQAVEDGDIDIVKALVSEGVEINIRSFVFGRITPLISAIENQHWEIAKFLIEHGADVNMQDDRYDSRTPLMIAIELDNIEIFNLLLDKGAKVNDCTVYCDERTTPLMTAIDCCNIEMVKTLLAKGASVAQKDEEEAKDDDDEYGFTLLRLAIEGGNIEILNIILELGIDIHCEDEYERTILLPAIALGDLAIVKCLIEHGADAHAKNKNGFTTLMCASENGRLDIVEYLIEEKNVDIDAKTISNNFTALEYAEYNKHDKVSGYLRRRISRYVMENGKYVRYDEAGENEPQSRLGEGIEYVEEGAIPRGNNDKQ